MQTDPNWANFLFTPASSSAPPHIQLIDFGASREYTKQFMDGWYRLLKSALEGDREKMRVESLSLGYLTGQENDVGLFPFFISRDFTDTPLGNGPGTSRLHGPRRLPLCPPRPIPIRQPDNHRLHPRTHPHHAQTPSHPATPRNVFTQ